MIIKRFVERNNKFIFLILFKKNKKYIYNIYLTQIHNINKTINIIKKFNIIKFEIYLFSQIYLLYLIYIWRRFIFRRLNIKTLRKISLIYLKK